MNFNNIITEIESGILKITINRPLKLNALNKETLEELHIAIVDAQDNKEVGGIILTGSGEKAFVAGADISEFSDYSVEEGTKLAFDGQDDVFDMISNSEKPVLAAINGFALGGGLELALACHIRIASENANLGLPEVTLGLIPGYGGTQRLTQLVGKGRAMEMILTANMIGANEALNYGLVNNVTTTQELMPTCLKMMETIISRSPIAISAAIRAINAGFRASNDGFMVEIEEFGKCFGTDDFKEGVSAFLEKRKPLFVRN